ncbi:unnamed protein product [Schistosoma margrebowiei]|uniref:Uncharacterized protein n=2 Tax=Schistosoma margrebowiei TaxID=48269 RepID=A0A183M9M2_9TREM|nr:unnamed protein product [Schistosoma margrebowiei]
MVAGSQQLVHTPFVSNSLTTTDNYDNSSSIQSKLYKDMNSYLSIKEYSGNYGDIPSPCPMYHTGPELHHMNQLHNSLHKDWIYSLFRDCIYVSKCLKNEIIIINEEEIQY